MSVNIEFTPSRLKALVKHLEDTIKVATGQPVRLDIEKYINELKKYKQTGFESDIPQIASLERLCYQIPLMQKNDLLETFIKCIERLTTKSITASIVLYYFDNYEDEDAKNYLFNNIQKEVLNINGWDVWAHKKSVYFSGKVVNNLVNEIIKNKVPIDKIPNKIGLDKPYRIREDALSLLCEDKGYFTRYISSIDLGSIIDLLCDEQLKRLHTPVWNTALPKFVEEAKEIKIEEDEDHELFALAKMKLTPTKSPQWQRLSEKAKMAYQEWAIGTRLEAFFEEDTDNKRILFWKRYIRHINKIKEIEYRYEIAAFSIEIGKYEFIEFRDIGAIYVYPKGKVRIPNSVTNLDRDLKFRDKVINPGAGPEHGEGWVPHWGNVWTERVNRLIKIALSK
ncbi:MAG: hypothetical protein U9N54_02585 [candidate division Zixibacteria bacterium]|nr:hypothetical protein [candidate division Zixibacteria bacterium]